MYEAIVLIALLQSVPADALAAVARPLPPAAVHRIQDSRTPRSRPAQRQRSEPPPPPPPDEPGACALAYHRHLEAAAGELRPRLSSARALLQVQNSALPGRWMTSDTATSRRLRPQRPLPDRLVSEDRVCVHLQQQRGGRIRCLKWVAASAAAAPELDDEPAPPPPVEAPLQADELALVNVLSELVVGRGLAPELGRNGRLRVLLERVIDEMRGYLAQAPTAGLCTGVPEMVAFYSERMAPQRARARTVATIQRDAEALRTRRIAVLSTPTNEPSAQPAETRLLDDVLLVLTAAGAEPMERAAIRPGMRLPEALRIAVLAVNALDAGEAAAESVGVGTTPADPRLPAMLALRAIEIAFYAQLLAGYHATIEAGPVAALEAIRAGHAATCTCGEN